MYCCTAYTGIMKNIYLLLVTWYSRGSEQTYLRTPNSPENMTHRSTSWEAPAFSLDTGRCFGMRAVRCIQLGLVVPVTSAGAARAAVYRVLLLCCECSTWGDELCYGICHSFIMYFPMVFSANLCRIKISVCLAHCIQGLKIGHARPIQNNRTTAVCQKYQMILDGLRTRCFRHMREIWQKYTKYLKNTYTAQPARRKKSKQELNQLMPEC